MELIRCHRVRAREMALFVISLVLIAGVLVSSIGADARVGDAPPTPPSLGGSAASFSDVPDTHLFAAEIGWVVDEGIAHGYPDGTYQPTTPITRQEMAAFLHRYTGGPLSPPACLVDAAPDVPANHPFCADIAWLLAEGIAEGYPDGTYRPAAPITRQVMAALMHRLEPAAGTPFADPCTVSPFPDVTATNSFCADIAWLAANNITHGLPNSTFWPAHPVSRQAMAAFLQRLDAVAGAPVPSAGCGTSTTASVLSEQRFLTVNTTERWYLLTTPAEHDGVTPLPLVLDFHGFAEGAQIHTQMSEFNGIAEREGFVVVYPHGTGDPVFWNTANSPTNPDLQYVDALLDLLETDLCIDTSRVYVAGLSNGAFMTSLLGCSRADRIAAIAPVAGVQRSASCAPTSPVPVLAFHGTADPILLFNGGFGQIGTTTTGAGPTTTTTPPDLNGPGYPAAVAAWAAGQGCNPTPVDTPVTDEVLHRVYDCPRGADVEFFILIEGGHAWPGSAFSQAIAEVIGYTTTDIHASEEAWEFFERHRLN